MINEELLHEIMVDVQSEWGAGGLYVGIYGDFILEVLKRYLEKVGSSAPC